MPFTTEPLSQKIINCTITISFFASFSIHIFLLQTSAASFPNICGMVFFLSKRASHFQCFVFFLLKFELWNHQFELIMFHVVLVDVLWWWKHAVFLTKQVVLQNNHSKESHCFISNSYKVFWPLIFIIFIVLSRSGLISFFLNAEVNFTLIVRFFHVMKSTQLRLWVVLCPLFVTLIECGISLLNFTSSITVSVFF